MAKPRLTQEMRKYTLTVSLAAGHPDSGIATFLRVARPFVLKIRREQEAAREYLFTVSHTKWYCWRFDINSTLESCPSYNRQEAAG